MTLPDWPQLFALSLPALEIVARGSAVYWFVFLVFRFLLRRDAGSLGIADMLLLVLIADASQAGMAGGAHSVTDALLLMSTIIGWNLLIDWLAFRYRPLARLLEPRPLLLIKDGRILYGNLRREMISTTELAAKLRDKGFHKLDRVRRAHLEPDGEISVMARED